MYEIIVLTISNPKVTPTGDKNISILHLYCRTSDLKFSPAPKTHALVL